jgi:hypothetical protein
MRPAVPVPDPAVLKKQKEEADRVAAEAERQRQADEARRKQKEFEDDRDKAAESLKDRAASDTGLLETSNAGNELLGTSSTDVLTDNSTLRGITPSNPLPAPLAAHTTKIGAAAAIRGEVYWLTPSGKKVLIRAGDPIMLNARIVTGPTAHFQLLLLDETVFTLGPGSDMVLDEFVYDPNENSVLPGVTAKVVKGTFRFVTGKSAGSKPDRLRFKLPAVAGGIRGTDIEATVRPDGSGYIKLFSGEIDLKIEKTAEVIVIVPGQMITFSAKGVISNPRKMLLIEKKPSL